MTDDILDNDRVEYLLNLGPYLPVELRPFHLWRRFKLQQLRKMLVEIVVEYTRRARVAGVFCGHKKTYVTRSSWKLKIGAQVELDYSVILVLISISMIFPKDEFRS